MHIVGLRSTYRAVRERVTFRQAANFTIRKAAGLSSPVKLTIDGISVFVRPNSPDFHVADKTIGGEFDDVALLVEPLQYKFIVDAGGYIGTVSVMLARAFPNATIVTLEPSQENFAILERNTEDYGNIIPLNAALGASEGRATFFDHEDGPWGYSLLHKTLHRSTASRALHEVKVVTIPMLLSQFGASGIDLLKLDIEGAERELLATCPRWVTQTRVIAAELHDWVQPGCDDAFKKATRGRKDTIESGELKISTISY